MRVLGIDLGNPGGLAVVADEGLSVHGGKGVPGRPWCMRSEAWGPRMKRLELQKLTFDVGREEEVDLVATERPGMWGRRSIGMAQREKQALVRAACEALQVRLVDYQPQTSKVAVCANGRATKKQVGRAVQALIGIASDNEHILDAAAIALVALNRERKRRGRKTQRRLHMAGRAK